MNKTSIEWTDYTWNPVTGCDKVSQGCKFCYADQIANRFWGDRKFTDVQMHIERLDEPPKYFRKWAGKKVFVCSMSDLFHEDVTLQFIDHVFATMAIYPDVTFQILTKRPERVLLWAEKYDGPVFPLPNVWIGVSCEDQATANIRIPLLLQIPAAVRFLSCEPLLGPIDLDEINAIYKIEGKYHASIWYDLIHWVIAGGESGNRKGVRPMHPDWVRSLRDQCKAANVPFFFKQWGQWLPTEKIDGDFVTHHTDTPGNGPPLSASKFIQFDTSVAFRKIGKAKSGNLLDGVQHLNFPTCL